MTFEKTAGLFRSGIADKLYSGAALGIGCGNEIYYTETAGAINYEKDAHPIDNDTLFDMASLSKILGVTVSALKLTDAGKLSPDDGLGKYFTGVPEDKSRITVRHLMTHTSGLNPWLTLFSLCSSPDEAADKILHSPLVYPTGENVSYSCMGFILLGKILEKITGKPLNQVADELVFTPFGMKNTGYRPIGASAPNQNIAYTETETLWGPGVPGAVHDENARFLGGISGNAGVFSTLPDMIKFAQNIALNRCGLSESLFKEAIRNYTPGTDENRGLGFQLGGPSLTFMGERWGNAAIGHTGYTGTSLMVDTVTGFYIVLLTNRVHPTRNKSGYIPLRRRIHEAAYDEFHS